MGTIATAWGITTGALESYQEALNISANNIANANTPGYTRESPVWQENDSVELNGAQFGMGARVTGASSQRDLVLEQRIQQQTQTQQATSARLTALQDVQPIFNDAIGASSATSTPNGGISDSMTQFFDALAQLEGSPSSAADRQQVLSTAANLAASFQNASSQLAIQQNALDQQAGQIVSQVNALTKSLAQLNQQIQATIPHSDAGSLEDQRQQDLVQLSSLIGISQIHTENNGLTITTTDGTLLVTSNQAYSLSTGSSGGVTHIYDGNGNDLTPELTLGGGQIGGILTVRDQDIPGMLTTLDTLAYGIGSQINTINQAGSDANGNAGGLIFNLSSTSAGAASTISVALTNPSGIAAAASGAGLGNNSNVTAMVNIQNAATIAGATPTAFYSSFVSSLGSSISAASTLNIAQQTSLTQLENQRNALSSVNLNDEAASLQSLERSYQAASKLFSILDSVLASALNMGVQTSVS
jgi:flagellar hook-associated protein 1 FlgK